MKDNDGIVQAVADRGGREFTLIERQPDIPKLRPGTCFRSAQLLACFRDGLRYAEGYTRDSAGEPVHHAWVVDGQSHAMDPTDDCEWPTNYTGVVFPDRDALMIRAVDRGFFDPVLTCTVVGELAEGCSCLWRNDAPPENRVPRICEISRDAAGFAVTVEGWEQTTVVRVDGGEVEELARLLDYEMGYPEQLPEEEEEE